MQKEKLEELSYDELTQLIDQATNIRTTKFENESQELEERRHKLEQDLEQAEHPATGTGSK